MSTFSLELPSGRQETASWAAVASIASYSSEATRRTYTTQLRLWMGWCAEHHLDPLTDIRRPHAELYARELEVRGLAAATVALKLVVLTEVASEMSLGAFESRVKEDIIDPSVGSLAEQAVPLVFLGSQRPRWPLTLSPGTVMLFHGRRVMWGGKPMASPARGGRGDLGAQLLRPGNEGGTGMSLWGTKQRSGLLLVALVTFGSLGAALPSAGAQDVMNRQQPSAAESDDGAVVLRHPRKAVFWTGGPVSGVALPEACAAGGCHELDLVVTVPPNGVTDLQVGIRWADESEDLDLYVYRPDGSLGDDSAGPVSTAESVLVEDSADGTYRVVVVASGGDVPSYEGFAQFEDEARRNGPVDDELLPDLVTLRVRQPQIRTSAYLFELPVPSSPTGCYPEETVEQGAQRCLRFDQIIANVGDGPFEIRYRMDGLGTRQDIDQRIYHADGTWHDRHADTYEFHPAHAHFHYENFARAHLWQSDASGSKLGDAPIRSGRKNGFCMVDVELHWWGLQGDAPRTYIPPSCLAPTDHDPETGYSAAVNGISVGWADVYNWYLADQFIEISGVPDGYYLLESVSDPADTVVEVSNTNNTSLTHIRLCGDDAGVVGSGAPCS